MMRRGGGGAMMGMGTTRRGGSMGGGRECYDLDNPQNNRAALVNEKELHRQAARGMDST
jgi:hypothetical protein